MLLIKFRYHVAIVNDFKNFNYNYEYNQNSFLNDKIRVEEVMVAINNSKKQSAPGRLDII